MKGKTLWGVSVLSEGSEQADPLVGTLAKTAAYLGMDWGGVLVGNGSRPGDVLADDAAMKSAVSFFSG
ncbi:hypothetical protein AB0F91_12530 [Amycolatopsis sp. NPDC023774]|uniref:hypothetical protein n=1 Tax=Amycolatopsis sp. NPDC023774 TaxID=3155015 RepID=UPI0033E6772E